MATSRRSTGRTAPGRLADVPSPVAADTADLSRVLTWPNAITAVRLALVPVYVWLLFWTPHQVLAGLLLGGLGMTDWVDGHLARRLGQVTTLGKVLDPIADRTAGVDLRTDVGQRHEHDVTERVLRVVGDAERRRRAVDADPLMVLAVAKLRRDLHGRDPIRGPARRAHSRGLLSPAARRRSSRTTRGRARSSRSATR